MSIGLSRHSEKTKIQKRSVTNRARNVGRENKSIEVWKLISIFWTSGNSAMFLSVSLSLFLSLAMRRYRTSQTEEQSVTWLQSKIYGRSSLSVIRIVLPLGSAIITIERTEHLTVTQKSIPHQKVLACLSFCSQNGAIWCRFTSWASTLSSHLQREENLY